MTKQENEKSESEETGEEVEERESEGQQDAEFMLSARRAPRQGIYEHLLSQFLAQAVICTDPLKRVKVICEAALMVQPKERENLEIDYEKIEVLNAVANALLYSSVSRKPFYREILDIAYVSWGFPTSEENFKKYIQPWINKGPTYYPFLLSNKHVEWYLNYGSPRVTKIIYEPVWEWFFEASRNMSPEGLTDLRNDFAVWAMPQVQLFLAELTSIVSPSLYSEILGLYQRHGKKGYAEKVKETAEVSVANEDSMGPY